IASATVDALRRSVLTLAPADPHRALRLADRALAIEPFDDSLHELVVDIQVSGGDRKGAWTYVDALRSRYRAELGIEIPERIRRPLERPVLGPANPLIDLRRSASALLELAHARMRAGDYPDAIEAAQRAAADGAASGDAAVERAALTTLASVLIHSVRGRDDEATRLLERALRLAQESGDQGTTAEIERELGYRWAEALILTDTVLLEEACDPGRIAAALALTRAAPLEAAHQRDLDIEATEGVHFERAWLDPVRYRVLQDGSSHPCDERLARSRDVVDGVKEFAHAGHHRELLGLARGGETLVEGADPGVAADRGERRHPERMAQRGVAERMEPRVPGPALAGLAQAGDRADEGADGLARDEARGVSEHREQVRRGGRPEAFDRAQQRREIGPGKGAADLAVQLDDARTQPADVFAGVAHAAGVGRALMRADGLPGEGLQLAGEPAAEAVATVGAQRGEGLGRSLGDGLGGRELPEDRGGPLAAEVLHQPGELGEAQIDQAVERADAVAQILYRPQPQAHQLAQLGEQRVGQARRSGALLEGEAGDAQRVDRVGRGPLQLLLGVAGGAQRVDERDRVAARDECGEEVAPVVAGRLHRDGDPGGLAQQGEEPLVPRRVLAQRGRPHDGLAPLAQDRDHVVLAADVDACGAHACLLRRALRRAPVPARIPRLVRAGTSPLDTDRASRAGRGRRSHLRELRPMRQAATPRRATSEEGLS